MKRLFIVLTVLFTINANADILKNRSEIDTLVQRVMVDFGKDELNKGLDEIKPYLTITDSEFEIEKKQFNAQASMLKRRYGNIIGTEQLSKEEDANSLVTFRFVQNFENHQLEWRLIFTKSKEGWVLDTYKANSVVHPLQWGGYSSFL